VLTEAFRRGVLKLFVDRELFEPEVAESKRRPISRPTGGAAPD